MYDIIFFTKDKSSNRWKEFKTKYPHAKVASSLEEAQKKSLTKMYWIVWDDLIVLDDFQFDYVVPKWDEQYIHVFKNGEYFDGICLLAKTTSVSKREFDYRFFVNKKEIDIVASVPRTYDIFNIESYEDYLNALEKTTTDLFWIIPNEVEPLPDFKFDLYFSHHNSYERKLNHVFKNIDVTEVKYNGIMLLSKHKPISKRELDFRFLIEKKEYEQVASKLKPYDIVFISYNEPNADENYQNLCSIVKKNKIHRVHKVKGIHQAHIAAAKLSSTPMFWVVDGDASVIEDFNFEYLLPKHDRDIVHVWRSRNPVNGLEYGNGGIKLLPKAETIKVDVGSTDMTTSISKRFRAMESVSNINTFNTDPYNTWKSAFRECVKLSSKVIDGQVDAETEERLNIWCTVGKDMPFGEYAITGAIDGRQYGQDNKASVDALSKINDFEWLYERFSKNSV